MAGAAVLPGVGNMVAWRASLRVGWTTAASEGDRLLPVSYVAPLVVLRATSLQTSGCEWPQDWVELHILYLQHEYVYILWLVGLRGCKR